MDFQMKWKNSNSSKNSCNSAANKQQIKCFLINAQGGQSLLDKKLHQLKYLLQSKNPDIVAISETGFKSKMFNSTIIGNLPYQIFRADRPRKKGGGACLIIHSKFNARMVMQIPAPKETSPFELICVDIYLPNSDSFIRIINVYRPPGTCKVDGSILLFDEIEKLTSMHDNNIILGDFNCPKIDWKNLSTNEKEEIPIRDISTILNFHQIINEPTRVVKEAKNILDLCFLSSSLFPDAETEISSSIIKSDHLMAEIKIWTEATPEVPSSPKYNYFKSNYDKINDELKNIKWNLEEWKNSDDVDTIYSNFKEKLLSIVHAHTPKTTPNSSKAKYPAHIKKLEEIRNRLRLEASDERSKRRYIRASIKYNSYLKNFEKYKENQMLKSRHAKQLYNHISKRIKDHNQVPVLEKNGKLATTNDARVEMMADEFEKNFNRKEYNPEAADSNQSKIKEKMNLHSIHPFMVLKELKNVKASAAAVPDDLPGIILKNCAENIAIPLATLFEIFLVKGKVPAVFRQSYVIPLSKKAPYADPANYRPISMTSQVCRINERIIAKQLLDHCLKNDIIPQCQYGFRPQRSTTLQIALCREWWFQAIERNECVDVIYLDFSKAFDSVPHNLLLQKLQKIGVDDLLLKWITDFLNNRTYSVTIGDSKSSERNVPSGVPQGTVLGPLLFSIYISDLPACINDENIRLDLFADDSKLSFRFDSKNFDPQPLLDALQKIHNWCQKWGLNLAASKTIVFHLGKNNPNFEYNINDTTLNSQNEVRDLGIIISNDLSMDAHINKIVAAAKQKSYLLFKILNTNDPNILIKAYTSYVRPILESSSTLFSPKEAGLNDLIESVQRKATHRIFLRCKSKLVQKNQSIPNYFERCQMLKLQTLETRRLEADAIFGIRLLQNSTIDSNQYIQKTTTVTRDSGTYHIVGKDQNSNHFYSTIPRTCRYMSPLLQQNSKILQLKTTDALKNHITKVNLSTFSNGCELRFQPVNLS